MYEPFYSDNSWNIINRNTWRIIKWSISWCSYYYIRDKKTIWKVYNHDIVAHCFLWEKPKWFVVDHIDWNKHNNHPDNLRYISVSDNLKWIKTPKQCVVVSWLRFPSMRSAARYIWCHVKDVSLCARWTRKLFLWHTVVMWE